MPVSGWKGIMKDTAKTIFRASLTPESIILGVAACNFIMIWVASSSECMGYICPWYYSSRWFTNEPARLLVAACLLRAGRAWGYSAAIALCGFILLEGLPGYVGGYAHSEWLESLRTMWKYSSLLSLHNQHLLAGIILMCSAVRWGRGASVRRGGPLR